MTAQRYVHPLQQWFDLNGEPANGYQLFFYQTLTDTPLAVYEDEGLTTPFTQPVESDSTGVWPVIFMQDAVYKVVLQDDNDVEVWSQDPYDATDNTQTITSFYDPPICIQGKPTNGEVYPIWNIVRSLSLPANLTRSIFTIGTLPTSTLTITIYKGATIIGTIAFSTLGVATVTFLSTVNFAAGDKFSLVFPASADSTGANISLTFVFTVL